MLVMLFAVGVVALAFAKSFDAFCGYDKFIPPIFKKNINVATKIYKELSKKAFDTADKTRMKLKDYFTRFNNKFNDIKVVKEINTAIDNIGIKTVIFNIHDAMLQGTAYIARYRVNRIYIVI